MTKLISVIFATLLLISCNTSETNNVKGQQQIKDSLNIELNAINEKEILNGFSVSIVNDKGTLYQNGFGYADIEARRKYTDSTIQNIASISKTFVGIALLKAQELGKLKLDDPISKYLPFKVVNPNYPQSEITIRNLATHTSSIIDNDFYITKDYYLKPNQNLNGCKLVFDEKLVFNPYDSIVALDVFLKNLLTEKGKWHTKNIFLNRRPGELYEYSNTGATLAGYIVELATGQSLNEFTATYILKPLKMNASGWKFNEIDFSKYSKLYESPKTAFPFYSMISYPDGNFITSINDLSLYLTELIKGYEGNGTILNKDSYKELYRQQLTAKNFKDRDDKDPYSESYNVGIFMGFSYTGYIGHTGGDPGVNSFMFFNPKTKIGRILICNTSYSDKVSDDTFNSIWDKLEKYQLKINND
jgi:CubicO group peptidase (beta-lactamase class C family)